MAQPLAVEDPSLDVRQAGTEVDAVTSATLLFLEARDHTFADPLSRIYHTGHVHLGSESAQIILRQRLDAEQRRRR